MRRSQLHLLKTLVIGIQTGLTVKNHLISGSDQLRDRCAGSDNCDRTKTDNLEESTTT